MGYFDEWLREKGIKESFEDMGSPVDNFRFNSDSESGEENTVDDHEKVKSELFEVVYSKYPTETLQFLDGLAQRGDEEVNALLSKLKAQSPNNFKEPRDPENQDEVVPPESDTGQGGEFEGE